MLFSVIYQASVACHCKRTELELSGSTLQKCLSVFRKSRLSRHGLNDIPSGCLLPTVSTYSCIHGCPHPREAQYLQSSRVDLPCVTKNGVSIINLPFILASIRRQGDRNTNKVHCEVKLTNWYISE